MFEKFTERGRKVIIFAKEEAEKRQNDYLGTEHLLLALLREEDGLPIAILKKMGLTVEELRMEIERNLPAQEQDTSCCRHADSSFAVSTPLMLQYAQA